MTPEKRIEALAEQLFDLCAKHEVGLALAYAMPGEERVRALLVNKVRPGSLPGGVLVLGWADELLKEVDAEDETDELH